MLANLMFGRFQEFCSGSGICVCVSWEELTSVMSVTVIATHLHVLRFVSFFVSCPDECSLFDKHVHKAIPCKCEQIIHPTRNPI